MKVLVVTANPRTTRSVRSDEELRRIRKVADFGDAREPVRIDHAPAARVEDLRERLFGGAFDVIHFIGHGSPKGHLIFEDERGGEHPISEDQFIELLSMSAPAPKCVVLNACFTSGIANAIAQSLGADCVGSTHAVDNQDAIAFASGFYQGLARGQDYEAAYRTGRASVRANAEKLFAYTAGADGAASSRRQDDWSDAPELGPLYGRSHDLDELGSWIVDQKAKIVAICGAAGVGKSQLAAAVSSGGMGKTNLAIALGRDLSSHFDRVAWRRLLNAPGPTDLVQQIVGRNGILVGEDAGIDELTKNLTDYLSRMKTLLVLDNYESVIPRGDRGGSGDVLATVLEAAATAAHESCVVLTSRIAPDFVALKHGPGKAIRLYELGGVDVASARSILTQFGVAPASEDEVEEINKIYRGNPLSLDLVARQIVEVHDGSVENFLHSERYAIDGIHQLLDWHVDRLAEDELRLAMLLAIKREPTELDALARLLLSPREASVVPTTLRRLLRQIPLERSPRGWSLQPVLVEHLTDIHVDRSLRSLRLGHVTDHLRDFPVYLATSSAPVRNAHRRFIVDLVASERWSEGGSPRSGAEAARDLLTTTRWDAEVGYALGSLLNLLLSTGASLAGTVATGTVREVDFTLGDARAINLTGARFQDCAFHETNGAVTALTITSKGSVAAVGTDGKLRSWSIESGLLEHEVPLSEKWLRCIAEEPRSGALITAGDDSLVRLTDTRTLASQEWHGHGKWVMSVELFPDGTHAVSAGDDDVLLIWNLSDGTAESRPRRHTSRVNGLAIDHTHTWLVSVSDDRSARITPWTQPHATTECRHPTIVRAVAFVGESRFFVTAADDGLIRRWDAATGDQIWAVPHHNEVIRSMVVSPDGEIGFSADDTGQFSQWNAGTGELVRAFPQATDRITALAIDQSRRWVASGGRDQTVRLWDLSTGALHRQFVGYSNPVWKVYPSQGSGFYACYEDGLARIWHINPTTVEYGFDTIGDYGAKRLRALANNRDRTALAGDEASILVMSASDRRGRKRLVGHTKRVTALSLDHDERLLSSSADGTVRLWDLDNSTPRSTFACAERGLNCVVTSAQSARCWAAGDEGKLSYIATDEALVRTVDLGVGNIWALALSPDETLLAVGGDTGGDILLIDADTLEVLDRISDDQGWIWSLEFLDSDRLLSSSERGTLSVWEISTRSRSWSVQAHSQRVRSATVLHTGDIAAGSDDGTVSVWRVGNADPIARVWPPRPYEGMRIGAKSGLNDDRLTSLAELGAEVALEEGSHSWISGTSSRPSA